MKSKLQAFTLFELILGMLLSAIVIGMVYSAWFLFSRVYGQYMDAAAYQAEVIAFRKTLFADVEQASLLKATGDEVVLLDSLGKEQLRYTVIEEGLVRKGLVADTFSFGQVVLQTAFEGRELRDSLADEVRFGFWVGEQPVEVFVRKYYSSADLFKEK